MKRYAIVIEKAENNYGAYVPDLPGCGALGDTLEETRENLRKSIQMHLKGMAEDGDAIPEPTSIAEYIEVEPAESLARKSA